ncbi:uncharacterized protein [Dysidea avara]|uniref:uncharacterized protein isoform X2 n=1 Tax=Dysidea avara TaxID=196820 RepID=UPI0033173B41
MDPDRTRSYSVNYGSNHGVVPALQKRSATVEDDSSVKRSIQRRHVYKGGDRRGDRNSLRVSDRSFDYSDGNIQSAKSAPGSGRSSPPDILSVSLAGQRAWSPGGMTNQPIEAKVVILGAQGVGKTSIVLRYVGKVFSNRVNSTIGASFFTFTMDVDSSTKVKIQLWDTAGQERFRSMAPMYYRKANAAIIVYDITSSKSFEQAKDWVDELHKNIGSNLALCIVGNKIDLPKDMRKVSTEKGREYANSLGALFAETSAARDVGIKEMFTNTAMKVVNLHQDDDHSGISSLSTSQFSKGGSLRPQHLQRYMSNPTDQHSQPTELPNIRLGPTQTDTPSQESSKKKEGWCCWR